MREAGLFRLTTQGVPSSGAPNLPVGVGRETQMCEINTSAGTSHELLAPSSARVSLHITELSLQVGAACDIVLSVEGGDNLGRWTCAGAGQGPSFDWQLSPRKLPAGKKLLATTSQATTLKGHKAWFEVAP